MKSVLDFEDFFEKIQMAGIFADSKTFPDLEPKKDIEEIVEHFGNSKLSIQDFINQNFVNDIPSEVEYKSDIQIEPEQHIKTLWNLLTKETKQKHKNSTYINLPKPFVVPGGRFQEVYYWDSFFTMLGLVASDRIDLVENILDNFAYLINTFGFIPNGNRKYFLSRSQPPFFALMVDLYTKNAPTPKSYYIELEKEYDFWMNHKNGRVITLPDGEVLNRYNDNEPRPRPESYIEDVELAETKDNHALLYLNIRAACESGWDFSSRWCSDTTDLGSIITSDILPVDLNSLLYNFELYLAENSAEELKSKEYLEKAWNRKKAIQKYFWHDDFYHDFNFRTLKTTQSISLAAVFPLYFNIADKNQAEKVAATIEKELLTFGGVMTTNVNSGQQWDAPNGWAPLQYMTIIGLKNYDLTKLSNRIKERWLALNSKVFKATGKFTEKYNVENPNDETGGGEYPNQDGFGWTNGVYLALKKL